MTQSVERRHNSLSHVNWGDLPESLLNKIFSLVPKDISSLRLVNKHWHRCSYDAVKNLQLEELNELVGDFPNTEQLDLTKVKVQPSDEDLLHLQKMPHLQQINFFGCWKLTANGLKNLQCLSHLKSLSLSSCPQISDDEVKSISSLSHLTNLNLSNCSNLTDHTFESLSNLREMLRLNLSQCENIAFEPNSTLYLRTLIKITAVVFSNSDRADDRLAESIAHLKSLQILDISWTRVTLTAILQFSCLSRLTKLKADMRKNYSENTIIDFRLLESLQSLNLSSSNLIDGHLASIADMKRLSSLKISHNPITTQGIKHLGKMTHLKKLKTNGLSLEKINPIAFESLTGLTSLCFHNVSNTQRNRLICYLPHLVKLNQKILHRDDVRHYRAHLSQRSAQSTKSISVVSKITHSDSSDRASGSQESVISSPDQSSRVDFQTPRLESSEPASNSLEIIISTPNQSSRVDFQTSHLESNEPASGSQETIISSQDQSSRVDQTPRLESSEPASSFEESTSSELESPETEDFSADKNRKKNRGFLSLISTGVKFLINGFFRLLGFLNKFSS